jgi:hypothetical protein
MHRCALAATIIILAAAPAFAAEPPRKLTYEQAIGLVGGLAGLDGKSRVVKDGQQERIVPEPYDIGPGLRLVIAIDLDRAKKALSFYQAAYNPIQTKFSAVHLDGFPDLEKPTGKVPDERVAAFNIEARKLNNEMAEGEFIPISYDELKPGVNNFPPSVLANLMPILVLPEQK